MIKKIIASLFIYLFLISTCFSSFYPYNAAIIWTAVAPITITAVTTNPTKGTTSRDLLQYYRNGRRMIARYEYQHTATGANGTGDYLFLLPGSLSFDTAIHPAYTSAAFESRTSFSSYVGSGRWQSNTTATESCLVDLIVYDATHFRVVCRGSSFAGWSWLTGNATYGLGLSDWQLVLYLDAQILGW